MKRFIALLAALCALTLPAKGSNEGGLGNSSFVQGSGARSGKTRLLFAQAAKGDAVENLKGVDARPFDFTSRTVTFHDGGVMPLNGLGTYALTGDVCVKAVETALESGVRLIDTAYFYGNEAEVGRALRESGVPRGEVFVITKIYPSQFGNAKQAIDEAVRKLDIGYIDMMLLHHPGAGDVNAYHAIEDAVKAGKVR